MARTRLYRNGVLEKENFPPAEISDSINDPGVVIWLDLCSADGEGLEEVEEEFGLHAWPSKMRRTSGSDRNSTTTARTCS